MRRRLRASGSSLGTVVLVSDSEEDAFVLELERRRSNERKDVSRDDDVVEDADVEDAAAVAVGW